MAAITVPWSSPVPGYAGHLVIALSLFPPRVRVRRVYTRIDPPAHGAAAEMAQWLEEVERVPPEEWAERARRNPPLHSQCPEAWA